MVIYDRDDFFPKASTTWFVPVTSVFVRTYIIKVGARFMGQKECTIRSFSVESERIAFRFIEENNGSA